MRSDSTEAFLADPYSYLTDRAVRYARTTRYLRHRPDECLKSRADDITGNLWTTDASGAVVRLSDPESREYFMRLYAELQAEQHLRSTRQTFDFDENAIVAKASAAYTAPRLASATPTLAPGELVRFSKYERLQDALIKGKFKISPGYSYADPSLTRAQFDDESRRHTATPNEQLKFKLYGRRTPDGPEEEMPAKPLEFYRFMNVPPFYVLCLSSRFDFRMFHDFKADAALVIRNQNEFARRVNAAMARSSIQR